MDSTSCAYRCAVTDLSGSRSEPSVYILGRSTDGPLISKLGTRLFSGEMKLVRVGIEAGPGFEGISVMRSDGRNLFEARVEQARPGRAASKLFNSQDDFVSFIKGGLSSYTPSLKKGHYSRVDLVEDSNHYVPLNAMVKYNWLSEDWRDADLVFDSTFHATGGLYRLKYMGAAYSRSLAPVIEKARA
jgi:hypothetical protein